MKKQSTIIMVINGRIGTEVGLVLMLALSATAWSQVNAAQVDELQIKKAQIKEAGLDGAQSDESTEKIQNYIRQLDATLFQEREQASASLSTLGIDAVRPLAIKAVTGSPESKWRAKQILEAIGVSGNEETFLKTANILKLLYLGASESLNVRISELQVQWKLEQKRAILKQLKQKGARVLDPSEHTREVDGPFALGPQVFFDIVEPATPTPSPVQQARFRPASFTLEESLELIDSVMLGSLEQNRERLLKDLPRAEGQAGNDDPFSPQIDQEILLQVEMRRRLLGAGNRVRSGLLTDGITITFDDQWQGDETDLQRLKELTDVEAIEIRGIDLSRAQLEQLAGLQSLNTIHIVGNELASERTAEFSRLKQLSQIHYSNRKIDGKSLLKLREMNNLTQFVFENCEFQPQAVVELSKLRFTRSLTFLSMPIETDLLEAMGKAPSLRMVNLELCKFQTAAYRQLRKIRPDIEINFTPQAMLGVRPAIGPLNGQSSSCEIAQIIPNSGAELGGMKPRDIVRKINGQSVEEFEDLRLHVAQHKSGDILAVTVEREGEEVQLKIQLMPFQMNE